MLQRLGDIVDRPARYAGIADDLDPLCSRLIRENRLDLGLQLLLLRPPPIIRQIVWIESHGRFAERIAEAHEQAVIAGSDDDVAVLGLEGLERRDCRVA